MRTIVLTAAFAAALGLSACQEATDGPEAADPTTEQEAPATGVILSGDGLGVGAETVALGASRDAATAAITRGLGAAPSETGSYGECGGGATDWAEWNGLTLLFSGDELVGWESQSPDLATVEGVHAGSTIQELRAAYPDVEIQETTVGWAFIVGDLYGHLDDAQTRVERIRLGVNCDAH